MSKGDELGERLYEKLDDVSRQIQHWGVNVRCLDKVKHYKEAKLSPAAHNFEFNDTAFDAYRKRYPQNLDLSLTRDFMDGDTHVLSKHAESILNAAKRNDADFFISLGKLLVKRKKIEYSLAVCSLAPKVFQIW
jgi:hypothetical protein